MAETKHDPGPWRWELGSLWSKNDIVCTPSSDGEQILFIEGPGAANRDLIAAAPAMYEALEFIANMRMSQIMHAPEIADAALALARGEEVKP